jgi:hypothetical protein
MESWDTGRHIIIIYIILHLGIYVVLFFENKLKILSPQKYLVVQEFVHYVLGFKGWHKIQKDAYLCVPTV